MNHMRDLARRPPLHDVSIHDIFGGGNGEQELEDLRQQVVEALTDENTPEAELLAHELVQEIEELVSTMEDKYRDLYLLRYHEQMDYDDIADVLKLPIGTVKYRMHELNSHIKELIKDYKLR